MKRRIIIITFLIVILIITTVFLFKLFNKPSTSITTYGNIEIRQVDLSFQVAGVINHLFVEEGDYVKKGDILATIDDRDYVANYNKALSNENSSNASFKEDFIKYKRNLPLCKDGTLSKPA